MLCRFGAEDIPAGVVADEVPGDVQHADHDGDQRQRVYQPTQRGQRRILVPHGSAIGALDTGARGARPHPQCEQCRQSATKEQTENQDLQRSLVVEPSAHDMPAFFAGALPGASSVTAPFPPGTPAPTVAVGWSASSSPAVRSPFHSALTLLWSTFVLRDRREMAAAVRTSRAKPTSEPT